MTKEELCKDSKVYQIIYDAIREACTENNLAKKEIPIKIHICAEEWVPDNELLTAAFKLKRNNVLKFYQKEVAQMFQKWNTNKKEWIFSHWQGQLWHTICVTKRTRRKKNSQNCADCFSYKSLFLLGIKLFYPRYHWAVGKNWPTKILISLGFASVSEISFCEWFFLYFCLHFVVSHMWRHAITNNVTKFFLVLASLSSHLKHRLQSSIQLISTNWTIDWMIWLNFTSFLYTKTGPQSKPFNLGWRNSTLNRKRQQISVVLVFDVTNLATVILKKNR